MTRILCIFPDDRSTKFLNRIQNHLNRNVSQEFHCYKVKPTQISHDLCLKRLSTNDDENFIIFLGHGRSNCLFGANSYPNAFVSPIYEETSYYENENFINNDNISVFKGKKVFCLSCNSAEKLGRWAVQQGARAFIGFGRIPTDNEILDEVGKRLPLLIARFKGEINWIIKNSLAYSINNNQNFYQLKDTVRLFTQSRINRIILKHRSLRNRRLLADYLYQFIEEMTLAGEGTEPLVD